MTDKEKDLARIVAEIEDEVRRKRATGEIPAALERKLDVDFARFAPVGATGTDLDQLLARAEERSHIELNPSVKSSLPGGSYAKRATRKAIRWYVRAIAEQVSSFAAAITRSVRVLRRRVEALEDEAIPSSVMRAAETSSWRVPSKSSAVASAVLQAIGSAKGRVLIAYAGEGSLVSALEAAGVDAYGIETDTHCVEACEQASLEVHTASLSGHLAGLEERSLAAVVLIGVTDTAPLGLRANLVESLRSRVQPGAQIVVIGTSPDNYAFSESQVSRELFRSQPISASSWNALLDQCGFVSSQSETLKDDVAVDGNMVSWNGYIVTGRAG